MFTGGPALPILRFTDPVPLLTEAAPAPALEENQEMVEESQEKEDEKISVIEADKTVYCFCMLNSQ